MVDCCFFSDAGVSSVRQLIELCYDAAHLWGMNPFATQVLPLDVLIELLENINRIAELRAENHG